MDDLTPYAGRWIALIGEQIVGVGHTAEEALQAAQHQRPKERAKLAFVEPEGEDRLPFSPVLDRVCPYLEHLMPVYIVGGAVRDALLGQASKDLDFVKSRGAVRLAFNIGDKLNEPAFALDRERDTGRVVLPEEGVTLDFARFRGPDLVADLRARDFTINALALPVTARTRSAIIDPTGGLKDLEARQINIIAEEALASDAVRTLRAVRLAASLDFRLTDETRSAIIAAGPLLADVSAERQRDELLKILMTSQPGPAMQQLNELGLLAIVLPEVAGLERIAQSPPHHEDVMSHTWHVLSWLVLLEAALKGDFAGNTALGQAHAALQTYAERLQAYLQRAVDGALDGQIILRLAALLHDVGKRETYEVDDNGQIHFFGHDKLGAELAGNRLQQLCLSRDAITQVKRIITGHMRPLSLANSQGANPSRRAVFRYFRALSNNGLDVALLALADHLATYNGAGEQNQWDTLLSLVAELCRSYFEKHEEAVKPAPLLNGQDLIDILGMKPGPEVGRILRLIEEGQAVGEITTREEALRFAQGQIA